MGNLQYRKVTREVEDTSFTCDIPSIDEYVKNSYYPTIVQHAYGYSISGRGDCSWILYDNVPRDRIR